jgi:hypothetical protein
MIWLRLSDMSVSRIKKLTRIIAVASIPSIGSDSHGYKSLSAAGGERPVRREAAPVLGRTTSHLRPGTSASQPCTFCNEIAGCGEKRNASFFDI